MGNLKRTKALVYAGISIAALAGAGAVAPTASAGDAVHNLLANVLLAAGECPVPETAPWLQHGHNNGGSSNVQGDIAGDGGSTTSPSYGFVDGAVFHVAVPQSCVAELFAVARFSVSSGTADVFLDVFSTATDGTGKTLEQRVTCLEITGGTSESLIDGCQAGFTFTSGRDYRYEVTAATYDSGAAMEVVVLGLNYF